jgi:hypothetical protein
MRVIMSAQSRAAQVNGDGWSTRLDKHTLSLSFCWAFENILNEAALQRLREMPQRASKQSVVCVESAASVSN